MPTRELPTWDLSDLYAGIDDSKLARDERRLLRSARRFARRWQGGITEAVTAPKLCEALKEFEALLQGANKLVGYAHMVASTRANDPTYGAFLHQVKVVYQEIQRPIIFFEVDLSQLSAKKLRALARDEELGVYRHYLERQLAWKPHRLSESEEKLVGDKNLTGREALTRLFDVELSGKEFVMKHRGKQQKRSAMELLAVLHDGDRSKRKAAARGLAVGLSEEADRLTFIGNMLAHDKAIDDRYRGFENPEAARHLENEVERGVVDTMVSVVEDNHVLVRDYYRLKKRLLGYRELYDYDRYAPVVRSTQTYSYRQAQRIVLDSFASFSPVFAEVAGLFFDTDWIDVPPTRGKRGGAYCMYVTPDVHPYVFLNYTGTADDVLTLAHELGHGVNGYLARKQSYLNFEWPMTIAETASIFGEQLVFDHLLREAKSDEERLGLYAGHIERAVASVFRQVAMFQFERAFHAERAMGEVPKERINTLWRAAQRKMFGNALTLTPGHDVLWSYIPHFVHWPFYVYAYAFGHLLSLSLYVRYRQEGEAMVSDYLTLMETGGSRSPEEQLRDLRVDWSKREFWQGGLDQIGEWIAEAKRLGS